MFVRCDVRVGGMARHGLLIWLRSEGGILATNMARTQDAFELAVMAAVRFHPTTNTSSRTTDRRVRQPIDSVPLAHAELEAAVKVSRAGACAGLSAAKQFDGVQGQVFLLPVRVCGCGRV